MNLLLLVESISVVDYMLLVDSQVHGPICLSLPVSFFPIEIKISYTVGKESVTKLSAEETVFFLN